MVLRVECCGVQRSQFWLSIYVWRANVLLFDPSMEYQEVGIGIKERNFRVLNMKWLKSLWSDNMLNECFLYLQCSYIYAK